MYRLKYIITLLSLIPFVSADSAVQTDWSGGPGELGPVIDWGDEFYQSSCINWSDYSGIARLMQSTLEHTVDGEFNGAYSVYSSDINGDGYMDILGTAYLDGKVIWWENTDGSGTSWTEHVVDGDFSNASLISAIDINGDGYMDILGAAYRSGGEVTWWENMDGTGITWERHTVWVFSSPNSIRSGNVNGDGYIDVLGTGWGVDVLAWWENTDGSGTNWTQHYIDGNMFGGAAVYCADINGDGYNDAVGGANYWTYIDWWENVDGSGTNWTQHSVVPSYQPNNNAVISSDINGDGDMDILAGNPVDITWWENMNGSGTTWTERTICYSGDAYSICATDVNGDGYMDVLGAFPGADDITWWENVGGSGTSWTEHPVDADFDGARSVYSADVNGDGYMDVLGAAYLADDITWWDLTAYLPEGSLESSILYLGNDPGWSNIDWADEEPAGTALSFQVRSCDSPDSTGMGAWSDTLHTPCSLLGLLAEGDSYFQYKVILQTSDPNATPILNDVTISWNPVSIGDTTEPIPPGIALLPIAPNPVAGSPVIRFGLPEPASVNISIFDLSGRLVSMINGEGYSPGYHDALLGDLAPGVYFCRMITGDFKATQRFVVIE